MDKADRGAKRACPECDTRFYDLNQDPATCPDCEHSFEISSLYQSDIRAPAAATKAKAAKAAAATLDDVEVDEDLLDDEDDAITVDDDLLEDDDDSTVSIEEIADVPTNDNE